LDGDSRSAAGNAARGLPTANARWRSLVALRVRIGGSWSCRLENGRSLSEHIIESARGRSLLRALGDTGVAEETVTTMICKMLLLVGSEVGLVRGEANVEMPERRIGL
jgi:hypothetical protein